MHANDVQLLWRGRTYLSHIDSLVLLQTLLVVVVHTLPRKREGLVVELTSDARGLPTDAIYITLIADT